jgi:hypothetical protein
MVRRAGCPVLTVKYPFGGAEPVTCDRLAVQLGQESNHSRDRGRWGRCRHPGRCGAAPARQSNLHINRLAIHCSYRRRKFPQRPRPFRPPLPGSQPPMRHETPGRPVWRTNPQSRSGRNFASPGSRCLHSFRLRSRLWLTSLVPLTACPASGFADGSWRNSCRCPSVPFASRAFSRRACYRYTGSSRATWAENSASPQITAEADGGFLCGYTGP